MTLFILSLVAFLALHSVPALPALRQRLIGALGRGVYLVLYSLVSVLALGWVFYAAFQLDYFELWPPSSWQAWFPLLLSPAAFFLLVSGLVSPNPVSVSFRQGDAEPGAVVSITRHPVLLGFLLWNFSHLVANGDVRSVMLFGILAVFAVLGILMSERRNRLHPMTNSTSIIPFKAVVQGRTRLRFDRAMVIALVATVGVTAWLLLGAHAALFGPDPLTMAGF